MNALQAKTALKAYGFDDNDPLMTWLEAGKQEVETAYDWPWLQVIQLVNALAGDQTISVLMPGNLAKIVSIKDTTVSPRGNFLEERDIVGFERGVIDPVKSGPPSLFTVLDSEPDGAAYSVNIRVWPVPLTAVTYRIVYQKAMPDLSGFADLTALPGPIRFHYIYVMSAAALALQADNEEDRAANALAQAERAIQRRIRKTNAQLGQKQSVQNVMGY